jgi:hypothetical protein
MEAAQSAQPTESACPTVTSTLRTDIQITIDDREIDLIFKWYDHTASMALIELTHQYVPLWAEVIPYRSNASERIGFEPVFVENQPAKITRGGDRIAVVAVAVESNKLMITIAVIPLKEESVLVMITAERNAGSRALSVKRM